MFTTEQKDELKAKLDGSVVKQRKQGAAQVPYVAAWHVIAEANRISVVPVVLFCRLARA